MLGLLRAVVALALAANALAEGALSDEPTPVAPPAAQPPGERAEEPPPRWKPLSSFGMTLAAGGGLTDFTSSGAREVTDLGGAWDIRMAFRTRRLLGFEISYIGGANVVHSLGLDTTATKLIRNGVEGAMRLNAPFYVKDTLLEPYFAGGLGWNGYRITNVETATASVSPSGQNTLAVPIAAGFLAGYKGFVADFRGTFRPTFGQTTLRGAGDTALTNWDVGGMIGFEF
jgi:hypothetical protein